MRRGVDLRRLDERADRCGRRIEDGDTVTLNHVPEAARVGIGRDAFKDDLRQSRRQAAIGDVTMTGHPADVGSTPEDVVRLGVEYPLARNDGPKQIASRSMLDTFGFAR